MEGEDEEEQGHEYALRGFRGTQRRVPSLWQGRLDASDVDAITTDPAFAMGAALFVMSILVFLWGEWQGGKVRTAYSGACVPTRIPPRYRFVSVLLKAHSAFGSLKNRITSVSSDHASMEGEGVLIHTTGTLEAEGVVEDSVFGIRAPKALMLRRRVKTYQWHEMVEESAQGTGTDERIVRYHFALAEHLIDSRQFWKPDEHQNPSCHRIDPRHVVSDRITLGDFSVPPPLVRQLETLWEPLPPPQSVDLPAISEWLGLSHRLHPIEGGVFIGANPAVPEVGDAIVTFEIVQPCRVTALAMQTHGALEPCVMEHRTIYKLQAGIHDKETMVLPLVTGTQEHTVWMARMCALTMLLLAFLAWWTLV